MDDASAPKPPVELARPNVRLNGPVDDAMLRAFLEGLSAAEDRGEPLTLELTTNGGDADVGRRIAADVRLFRERTGRRTLFLGKAMVYSAGVTVLSAFGRRDRWLARGCALLVHCRQLNRAVELNGPLLLERARVEALLGEIDLGLRIEEQDFATLIEGSPVPLAELLERAQSGWYLDADEALQRGLIEGIL
ncbi:conserved hypothetical protein [Phenylobacterium zucineum HLK1]|uniref:Peptidase S14 n=1 Tax=Phenylobacterium zucineum (strain HLK1) TaxID=450851 RepID=B4RH84_PHEZH|nr:hypothetical protein [Phenylobacterium zucineum]ACG79032.1 conserved hypothetical protein [Phenylobacterium zucineum HLK1]